MSTPKNVPYGKHDSQFMTIYSPIYSEKNTPIGIVLLIHGGFFKKEYGLELMTPLAEDLVKRGYIVANLEYPRAGEGMAPLKVIQGIFSAYDKLCELEPTVTNRIVLGHSAGGYFASLFPVRKIFKVEKDAGKNFALPNKVLAVAAVSDLLRAQNEKLSDKGDAVEKFIESGNRMLIPDDTTYKSFSPINYRPDKECTVHILHGTEDELVPVEHSISLFERWRTQSKNVHFHGLGGVTHMEVIEPTHFSWDFQVALMALKN